jgi:anti-sigma factor ChrR (cupin superfamily)
MDHDRASELLGAYVLHSCDEGESAAIEGHVEACAECRGELDRLDAVAGLIGATDLESPPSHLRQAVLAAARTIPLEDLA